ncbi:hypothetical protein E3N88_37493 [Mikania micrantha]|uniref:Transmembrane protein n=1 Tax=Mikania micrantha TaxID=192012 RepID=A0A5N6LR93_9ASTR|nr:hypothetical protein E3N88_37493 [Mikania micrantha]
MDENEWETIQPSTSASQSDLSDSDADAVVLTTPTNFNNPPILDTTNHQESPLDDHHLQEPPPSSHSSSTTPYTTEIADDELPQPSDVTDTRLNASLGILGSWVLRIGYGMRSRIGFWSIASVGAFVALAAYARRWQRWRRLKDDTDKLMNLLNQKDEEIAIRVSEEVAAAAATLDLGFLEPPPPLCARFRVPAPLGGGIRCCHRRLERLGFRRTLCQRFLKFRPNRRRIRVPAPPPPPLPD